MEFEKLVSSKTKYQQGYWNKAVQLMAGLHKRPRGGEGREAAEIGNRSLGSGVGEEEKEGIGVRYVCKGAFVKERKVAS